LNSNFLVFQKIILKKIQNVVTSYITLHRFMIQKSLLQVKKATGNLIGGGVGGGLGGAVGVMLGGPVGAVVGSAVGGAIGATGGALLSAKKER